jgi:Zn-dependent membrane protease YugP
MMLYLMMMLPCAILALWAQARTKSAYKRFSKVAARRNLSGAQIARMLLDADRLGEVQIERIPGQLTDHYDPRTRVLRLSEGVHDGTSVAAIGVAAHEMGHAMQHADAYQPLVYRQALYPIASFASRSWIYLIIGSMFLPTLGPQLMLAAVILMSAYALFALVTLPVEFDASKRALVTLEASRTLEVDELEGARKVLNAAALTYVASAAQAVMMVIYMLMSRR